MGKLQSLIADWLRQLEIPVSTIYLKNQLLSHPDYPSLASITDVLEELGIENTAVEIDKESLLEIPVPFLAHLRSNGGEFVIVKNRNNLGKQFPKFFERWSGVVVLADKKDNWTHEANEEWLKRERKKERNLFIFLSLLLAFIGASIFYSFEWKEGALLLIAAAGIFVSWMIVSKDLGIENKLADHVCGKKADCNAVIQSKGARLPLGISWSDVGLIWFSSLLLGLLISSFTKITPGLYPILSLLATCFLPFTFFSIYYQWRVARKWCRLCLLTVVLLWMQFVALFPPLNQIIEWEFQLNHLLIEALLLFFVTSSWLGIKSFLKTNKRIESENFANLRVKNNPEVFKALLEKQRKVDIAPFEEDLQLGNPNAPLQIMVACNPYCGPCAKAHEVLHELVQKNYIGLTVRFTARTEDKEDKKFKAVEYVLRLLRDTETLYKRNILHDWYKEMNLEKFSDLYRLNGRIEDVSEIVKLHETWSEKIKIHFTPTIFINGYELPKEYSAKDLKLSIKGIIEILTTDAPDTVKELI
jgi:uncharacterized membrane protein